MAQMRTGGEIPVDEKVAIFLASLDEQTAAAILQQLDAEAMARIVNAIRSLGVIPGEVRQYYAVVPAGNKRTGWKLYSATKSLPVRFW